LTPTELHCVERITAQEMQTLLIALIQMTPATTSGELEED